MDCKRKSEHQEYETADEQTRLRKAILNCRGARDLAPSDFPRHHHYPHSHPLYISSPILLSHRTIRSCIVSLYNFFLLSMEDFNEKKRGRGESEEAELEIYSPEVKRLRENLLDGFDDEVEFCAATQDLDLFMKSFEEEIIASPSAAAGGEAVQLVDLTSDSGDDSRLDLGYLLEASDDELGLPPTASSSSSSLEGDAVTELVRVESDSSDLGSEFWEVPGYDSFEFGLGESESNYGCGNGEYVALDGLFDYSDLGFGSGDFGWTPETLPAQ